MAGYGRSWRNFAPILYQFCIIVNTNTTVMCIPNLVLQEIFESSCLQVTWCFQFWDFANPMANRVHLILPPEVSELFLSDIVWMFDKCEIVWMFDKCARINDSVATVQNIFGCHFRKAYCKEVWMYVIGTLNVHVSSNDHSTCKFEVWKFKGCPIFTPRFQVLSNLVWF